MGVIFGHRKAAERFAFGGYVSLVIVKTFPFRASSKRLNTMEQVEWAAREIADEHNAEVHGGYFGSGETFEITPKRGNIGQG